MRWMAPVSRARWAVLPLGVRVQKPTTPHAPSSWAAEGGPACASVISTAVAQPDCAGGGICVGSSERAKADPRDRNVLLVH
jgi:hypothetical protein